MYQPARVTVLIVAFERPEELRSTLSQLRLQTCKNIELLLIDDHSRSSLEPILKAEWPEARYVRNETNLGYIKSRSLGMLLATGDYVLSLDDDSCLTERDDIDRAVERMERDREIGVLGFDVYNGTSWPGRPAISRPERYSHLFTGCGHMIRKEVISRIGGYRDFYEYYAEEAEYALRVMNAGWRVLYYPSIVVHHRVSGIGRNLGRIWAHSLRNNLWTALLHFPLRRLPAELSWKISVGAFEALRLFEIRRFAWAIASSARGLARVLPLRRPLSDETIRLYDALRFGIVSTGPVERITLRQKWEWFVGTWMRRRRARAFWDRKAGGTGVSASATFLDAPNNAD